VIDEQGRSRQLPRHGHSTHGLRPHQTHALQVVSGRDELKVGVELEEAGLPAGALDRLRQEPPGVGGDADRFTRRDAERRHQQLACPVGIVDEQQRTIVAQVAGPRRQRGFVGRFRQGCVLRQREHLGRCRVSGVVCRPNRLHFLDAERSEPAQPLIPPRISRKGHETPLSRGSQRYRDTGNSD
jgi:hypothetical protein